MLAFTCLGQGPFFVQYSDGSSVSTLDSIANGEMIQVAPVQSTTYTLMTIQDLAGPGCAAMIDTSVTIEVHTDVTLTIDDALCEGDSVFARWGMARIIRHFSGFVCNIVWM